MTVRIERAHIRDVRRVKPLWGLLVENYQHVAAEDWPVRDPKDAWEMRHQEYLSWINDGVGVIFVAWDGDKDSEDAQPIGYAALHFVESSAAIDLGEIVGVIESLIVRPDRTGEGLGTMLLSACRRELERREISYCCIETLSSNDAALAVCTSNGFRPYMTRLIQHIELD